MPLRVSGGHVNWPVETSNTHGPRPSDDVEAASTLKMGTSGFASAATVELDLCESLPVGDIGDCESGEQAAATTRAPIATSRGNRFRDIIPSQAVTGLLDRLDHRRVRMLLPMVLDVGGDSSVSCRSPQPESGRD
jgi:hypothetical protein